jgi:hypothetical protein
MKGFITVTKTNGGKVLIYAPNYEFSELPDRKGCYTASACNAESWFNIQETLEDVMALIEKPNQQ